MTKADFHSCGNSTTSSDCLNKWVITGVKSYASFFKTLAGTWSGPPALWWSNCYKRENTSDSETSISCILGYNESGNEGRTLKS